MEDLLGRIEEKLDRVVEDINDMKIEIELNKKDNKVTRWLFGLVVVLLIGGHVKTIF